MPEILHIVLFRWKPGTTASQLAEVRTALLGLKEAVPGIAEIHCGENLSERGRGYQTVLVVRFESRAALEQYLPHPAHRAVVEQYIQPLREDTVVADIEL